MRPFAILSNDTFLKLTCEICSPNIWYQAYCYIESKHKNRKIFNTDVFIYQCATVLFTPTPFFGGHRFMEGMNVTCLKDYCL